MKVRSPGHLAYVATAHTTSSWAISPPRTPWIPEHPRATVIPNAGDLQWDFWDQSRQKSFQRCDVGGMGNLLLSSINKDFLLSLETPSPTY